jgi:hypothetical protein
VVLGLLAQCPRGLKLLAQEIVREFFYGALVKEASKRGQRKDKRLPHREREQNYSQSLQDYEQHRCVIRSELAPEFDSPSYEIVIVLARRDYPVGPQEPGVIERQLITKAEAGLRSLSRAILGVAECI